MKNTLLCTFVILNLLFTSQVRAQFQSCPDASSDELTQLRGQVVFLTEIYARTTSELNVCLESKLAEEKVSIQLNDKLANAKKLLIKLRKSKEAPKKSNKLIKKIIAALS